jgi:hypothetical protein
MYKNSRSVIIKFACHAQKVGREGAHRMITINEGL